MKKKTKSKIKKSEPQLSLPNYVVQKFLKDSERQPHNDELLQQRATCCQGSNPF